MIPRIYYLSPTPPTITHNYRTLEDKHQTSLRTYWLAAKNYNKLIPSDRSFLLCTFSSSFGERYHFKIRNPDDCFLNTHFQIIIHQTSCPNEYIVSGVKRLLNYHLRGIFEQRCLLKTPRDYKSLDRFTHTVCWMLYDGSAPGYAYL